MRDPDPRRIAILRDLLLDYPYEKASNHGEPPAGLTEDEQDAWVDDYMMRYGSPAPLEGRYDGEFGRPDGVEFSPTSRDVVDHIQGMRDYFDEVMPKAGQIAPVPDDPDQIPSRQQALAQRLRRS
ncbi:hypothetical protein [Microvirga tunisiensis]|uniref:Uncharacterized protein n=1 Tax=Microvirga tunisiensis TaxID=2108360 RepID=A0A5N7MVL8_9HYPH|nr:hypothetical protein [Microvirga tunisiensis]MPR13116.1 hypothetical protein [Microvirga tunisiensis]MPR31007.1 hypothetical protein [Microvirga tunisiensis]